MAFFNALNWLCSVFTDWSRILIPNSVKHPAWHTSSFPVEHGMHWSSDCRNILPCFGRITLNTTRAAIDNDMEMPTIALLPSISAKGHRVRAGPLGQAARMAPGTFKSRVPDTGMHCKALACVRPEGSKCIFYKKKKKYLK